MMSYYQLIRKYKMKQRPLSPHLQVYRPQITSFLSIMHRFSGIGLFLALVILVVGLGCLATSEQAFSVFRRILTGIIGQTILFFCLLGFYYHLANGIRHLAWDAGYGFELETTEKSGIGVVALAIALTILTWFVL